MLLSGIGLGAALKEFLLPLAVWYTAVGSSFLIMYYWENIENWLKNLRLSLKSSLKKVEKYAARLFASVKGNVMQLVYRLYYKEDGKWVERISGCEIEASKVPDWAKTDLTAKEQDVTARYEKELQISI